MKNWIINKLLDWATKHLKQEMNQQFGAPDGSIIFMWAAYDPKKKAPNVWIVTHPSLKDHIHFKAMCRDVAHWVREEIPAEVWDDM